MTLFKSLIICTPLLLASCVEEPPAERRAPDWFVMSDQFTPSGFTGQGEEPEVLKLHFDACPERAPGALGVCYAFEFRPREDLEATWVSVVWQSPANNWGRLPPKTIDGGGRSIRFKVRGSRPGWIFEVAAGGAPVKYADGRPYPYQNEVAFSSRGRAGPKGAPHFPFTTDTWTEHRIELPEEFDRDELPILSAFEWVYKLDSPGPEKDSPLSYEPITIYIDDIVWE